MQARPARLGLSHGPPQSLQYLSLRNSTPQVNLTMSIFLVLLLPSRTPPRRKPPATVVSPLVTIHDLPLDAVLYKLYSVPIFDALAPLAISVAVQGRTPLRCNRLPAPIHPIS